MIMFGALAGCGDSSTPAREAGSSGCATGYAGCSSFQDGTTGSQTITFGTAGNTYQPSCLKVKVGQQVTFSGTFSVHPLTQACGPAQVITNGSGTSTTFTFATAGLYGYYCAVHGFANGNGMAGSIQVVP
jgi:plastocyanin